MMDSDLTRLASLVNDHLPPEAGVEAHAILDRLREPLPCGHPSACVSTGAEGTSFCRWCEEVGRLRDECGQRKSTMDDAAVFLEEKCRVLMMGLDTQLATDLGMLGLALQSEPIPRDRLAEAAGEE